jgi:uncharacterized LabA/DUF88 family protein
MKKIAVFVDVQNIYYTTRSIYSAQFDYRSFWRELSKQGDIVQANAYATNRGDDGQSKFQDALRHIGFNIKLKPYIQRADGSAKGDWDVGITIDIMKAAENVDEVVLLSGDGDFAILLSEVMQHNKVSTTVHSVAKLTAKGLMDSCNTFKEIKREHLL